MYVCMYGTEHLRLWCQHGKRKTKRLCYSLWQRCPPRLPIRISTWFSNRCLGSLIALTHIRHSTLSWFLFSNLTYMRTFTYVQVHKHMYKFMYKFGCKHIYARTHSHINNNIRTRFMIRPICAYTYAHVLMFFFCVTNEWKDKIRWCFQIKYPIACLWGLIWVCNAYICTPCHAALMYPYIFVCVYVSLFVCVCMLCMYIMCMLFVGLQYAGGS